MHINWQVCSLIVQAKGEQVQDISTQLNALPGCEVAVSDEQSGQMIAVVEAEHCRFNLSMQHPFQLSLSVF
ncbi:hypothetical protein C2U53_27025 [Citrobacter sp. CFNIH10]|nr:hypothetical protein C2U53_27025 [Citrobacter sp. CFNIH10]